LSGIEIKAIEAWLRHDRDCDCAEILQIVTRAATTTTTELARPNSDQYFICEILFTTVAG
jgi:hypothetical protein